LALVVMVLVAVIALAGWFVRAPAVYQPIEFPHRVHLELESSRLDCASCHEGAETRLVAGAPSTESCLSCHSGETESAEVRKLQAYGDAGDEVPWRRVWRLTDDIFFSHRQHVAIAGIACQTCHGDIGALDRPPVRPLRTLSMADCTTCHATWRWPAETPSVIASRPIAADCNACHR
jgi:hypothetical protein